MRNLWMALLSVALVTGCGDTRKSQPQEPTSSVPSSAALSSRHQTDANGSPGRPGRAWDSSLRGVLSTGTRHTLALDADGTVWTWGENTVGQLGNGTTRESSLPIALVGIEQVKFIEAGGLHTLALREDGTVWSWGFNLKGQLGRATSTSFDSTPAQVPGLTGGVALAAGSNHSLALREDGTIWSWGHNVYGQLGWTTSTSFDLTPAQVPGLTGGVALAAGSNHSLALREDGTVWSWGHNVYGQLGRTTSTSFDSTPAQVPGLTDIVALSAGDSHSLALRQDGTVWAWGHNRFRELGFPDATLINPTPRQVPALTGVVDVAAGQYFSLALRADGSVWAWGFNPSEQIFWEGQATPQRVDGPKQVIALAAGERPLVMSKNGTVWGWGWNDKGLLGTGTNSRNTPVRVRGLTNVVTISAAPTRAMTLREDGTVWGWGDNRLVEISPDIPTLWATPIQVLELPKVVALATGDSHTLALSEDGTVWGWGDNTSGQRGPTLPTARPVQVPDLTDVVALAAGSMYSLALREDGTVWAMGGNFRGQLGRPPDFGPHPTPMQVPGISGVVALSSGVEHALALREDGTVWAWGGNTYGLLGVDSPSSRYTPAPVPGLTDVVALSAGRESNLALRKDGTVWAWGDNTYGQLGDGTRQSRSTPAPVPGLTDVVGLTSTAYGTSLVVRRDGTVWGFGHNNMGLIANTGQAVYTTPVQRPGLSRVTALSIGTGYALALREDGTVLAWGSNSHDQIGDGVSSIHTTAVRTRLPCRFTGMASRDHRASEPKHCPTTP